MYICKWLIAISFLLLLLLYTYVKRANKYYQKNKQKLPKEARKDTKIFLKKNKKNASVPSGSKKKSL